MKNMNNVEDISTMKNYYRTSDMINLLYFFPELSPIRDLTIVDNIEEYLNNKNYFDSFSQNRVDTVKGRTLFSVENSGSNNSFYETLLKVKEKDKLGALVLFNLATKSSERYSRYAGISVGVNLGEDVIIDAVSRGFDGREVSKSISCHERYYIPWFELRNVCIENFKKYQTYKISDEDYILSRCERIDFLTSVGIDKKTACDAVPEKYNEIPDVIWLDVIQNLIKQLEKNEDILRAYGFTNFAISGHTEGEHFAPWQMFDKSRYTLAQQKVYKKNKTTFNK